jgi:hypothetical protein
MVLDVTPKTFNRANTYIRGSSWKAFQRRHPSETFEEFWELCINRYMITLSVVL